ncbi:hypothetical protein BLD44_010130 [Mastigocladus laminosus UU774]|nr:hypothetical protein BLD44_010130 [Mastigocladus laminosus UU774]
MKINRRKYPITLAISKLFAHIRHFSAQVMPDKNSVFKRQRLQAGNKVGFLSNVGINLPCLSV